MRRVAIIFAAAFFIAARGARADELADSIAAARSACDGIEQQLQKMKSQAVAGAVITGVGAAAGAGAATVGFVKAGKDAEAESISVRLNKLREIEEKNPTAEPPQNPDDILRDFAAFRDTAAKSVADIKTGDDKRLGELETQSKNLGNWRTGLAAGNAAANIAGAAVAGTNKIGTLADKIKSCANAAAELERVATIARFDGADTKAADKIAIECGKWKNFDASKIDARADGAAWSAGIGAAAGAAGAITSAMANTNATRGGDAKTEKNLNTAANFLSIGGAAGGAAATGFGAAHAVALDKAAEIAKNCGGAL